MALGSKGEAGGWNEKMKVEGEERMEGNEVWRS